MKVGFDIDFTLTTGEVYEKVVQMYFPKFELHKHYTKYPLEYSLMTHGFMSDTNPFNSHFMCNKHKQQLYGEETIAPGFMKLYNLFIEHGIELYFICTRNPNSFDLTKEWLERNGISNPRLYCLGNYRKYNLVKELGITLFYEGNVKNAYDILENTRCSVRLKEQPYNKLALWGFNSFSTWTTEYRRFYQILNYRNLEEIDLWQKL